MSKKLQFTLGSDPEFFLKRVETGELVSSIPYIDGTKYEPKPLPNGGNVQRDNVAVEIGTDVVVSTAEWDWINSLHRALLGLDTVIPEGMDLVVVPSADFPASELEHEEAKRFGCDPDYDAWEMVQNEPPCAMNALFRSCGGHVHVGGIDMKTCEPFKDTGFLVDFPGKIQAVKAMDCFHGILFSILDCSEAAVRRRELYGKAGCHRPTDYGVEYRSLSNMWMLSPFTAKLVHELTNDAMQVIKGGKLEKLIKTIGETEIRTVINTGNADSAMKIMENHLWSLMGDESRFFFNQSLAKVKANDMHFRKEWKDWSEKREAMFGLAI